MDLETYARSKFADYAALAETVRAVLQAAIGAYPETFRLQQVQQRPKNPESLRKKLEDRGILGTISLENDIKDLAGCRLIFYANSDVARFLQSGIIQDNFDVDWDRNKIHHPVPGQTAADNLFISNNYFVRLKADRTALPEYARFSGLWCEVQVQTTLNHAWSEMEHDIIVAGPRKTFGRNGSLRLARAGVRPGAAAEDSGARAQEDGRSLGIEFCEDQDSLPSGTTSWPPSTISKPGSKWASINSRRYVIWSVQLGTSGMEARRAERAPAPCRHDSPIRRERGKGRHSHKACNIRGTPDDGRLASAGRHH
jgi:ppGpp synthetase/RelA/SpoT-type nucleotidyltranferase